MASLRQLLLAALWATTACAVGLTAAAAELRSVQSASSSCLHDASAQLHERRLHGPPSHRPHTYSGVGIPRVIHQVAVHTSSATSKTGAEHELARRSAAWPELMPAHRHVVWNNSAVRALIAECVPRLLRTYDEYPLDIHRADAARYVILLCVGGLYADRDMKLLRPLPDAWFESADVRLLLSGSSESLTWVTQGFAAAEPGHPFFQLVLDSLENTARWWDVMEVAGPHFFQRAMQLAACLRMRYTHLRGSVTQSRAGRSCAPNAPDAAGGTVSNDDGSRPLYSCHAPLASWASHSYKFIVKQRCPTTQDAAAGGVHHSTPDPAARSSQQQQQHQAGARYTISDASAESAQHALCSAEELATVPSNPVRLQKMIDIELRLRAAWHVGAAAANGGSGGALARAALADSSSIAQGCVSRCFTRLNVTGPPALAPGEADLAADEHTQKRQRRRPNVVSSHARRQVTSVTGARWLGQFGPVLMRRVERCSGAHAEPWRVAVREGPEILFASDTTPFGAVGDEWGWHVQMSCRSAAQAPPPEERPSNELVASHTVAAQVHANATRVFIVAHADDWQLFAGEHAARAFALPAQHTVIAVLSAGDAGRGELYWRGREQASLASVRALYRQDPFRPSPSEHMRRRQYGEHSIQTVDIDGPNGAVVTHAFFRLPDALVQRGSAQNTTYRARKGSKTLASLLASTDASARLRALDSETNNSFSVGSLVTSVAAMIDSAERAAPAGRQLAVFTHHDADARFYPNWKGTHQDHLAVATIVQRALQARSAAVEPSSTLAPASERSSACVLVHFADYVTKQMAANVEPHDAAVKTLLFSAYDLHLNALGLECTSCASSSYRSWLRRSYARVVQGCGAVQQH